MTIRPALPRRSCAAPVLALLLFAAPLAAAPVVIGDIPNPNPNPNPEPATSVAIDPLAGGALCIGRPVAVSATCVEAVPSDDEPAPVWEAAAGRSFLVRTRCSQVDGEPLRWVVVQTGQQGSGGAFSFVATNPGPHQVMAVAGGRIVATVSYWIDGDSDGDGLSDSCDNCPAVANLEQGDADADGYGDTCDTNPVGPCQTETEPGTLVALQDGELAAVWGGAEQKCSKCDTATTKCPAQTASDCQCTSVSVGIFTFNRCGVSCPSGGGYRKCIKSDKETDKCDPVKTTARWCTSYAFKWDGPGKPPSCPANFDCNNNPGTGSSETVPGDHASCS